MRDAPTDPQPGARRVRAAGLDRRSFLRLTALGLGGAAAPSLLAACSRPGASGGGDSPAAATGSATPQRGGTLVFAVDDLTGNSDPGTFSSFGNWMVIDCVARGLTHVDYRSTEPQPALAESWTVSPDQLTYTFRIRQGVTFHDGGPVRAQDFERSWRRLFDEEDPTRAPNTYASAELGGENVVSFKAQDEATFVVQLKAPDVAFLARCSNPNSVALSSAAIEREGQAVGDALVGSGPFRFGSFTQGQSVTLERFDDYWEGAPYLDRVVFQILPDPAALTSALTSGSVNASNFAPVTNVPQLRSAPNLQVADAKPYIDIFVGMNMGQPALADLRVRQAINYAIDRDAIASAAFAGTATPPAGLVSPPELGYDESLRVFSTRDVDRAKQLLSEAGADGREVTAVIRNQLFWPRIGQIVEQNLQEIGLQPRFEYLDPASLSDRLNSKSHQIFVDQRSAFVADPDNKLTPLLAGDSFVNQTLTQNYLDRPRQARLDQLLVQARGEADQERRRQLYVDIQRFFAEEIMVMAMAAYIYLPTVSARNVVGLNADALGTYRAFFEETGLSA